MAEQTVRSDQNEAPPISFLRLITTCISARLLVDIGTQMFNPFLPIFAAGLNTDVVVMGRLVSLRSAMGMLAPIFGSWADRVGYRRVLRVALIISAVGMMLIGVSQGVRTAVFGMVGIGLGLAGFVPTVQAYMSARLPYAQRARGMGMLEYSWALTGIFGLSLMGQLIALTNWRVPFFVLSGGLLLMSFVFYNLPPAPRSRSQEDVTDDPSSGADANLWRRVVAFFRVESNAVSTYAVIGATAVNFFGAMQMMIVHGAWLANEYSLDARQLGYVALLFGCFDLTASVSVSLFTDRFGKRRSVLLGTIGALTGYLLIPWLNIGVVPAVLSAALARGFFEFAIVANFPLLSEQVPSQRAKFMTLSAAINLGMATLASAISPGLYLAMGIAGIATISAVCTTAALFLLLAFVKEPELTLDAG